ncbi:hypothetical protein BKA69DRAFT_260004 [Paraphysoderma sedebokerense]|nr:hypothetical protein BKA69DRAFT_260004 [Paraphysoderma sedebokerense]
MFRSLRFDTKPKSLSIPSLPNEPKMKNSKLKFQNVPNGDEASMSEDNPFFQYIIPRAVYKNAIKAVPNDLTFRTEFLSIYSKYEATEIAREEVYQTLMENFASDSKALSIVFSRHISSTLPTSPAFPRQLKMVVDDFVGYCDDNNLDDDLVRGLYEEFCSLLVRLLQTVQDSNLVSLLK